MVETVLGHCYGLVQVSALSWLNKIVNISEPLQVLSNREFKFVNVDTSSIDDIHRAISLDLVDSNLVNFISSPKLFLSSTLFTPIHKARMFTLLRHPFDLAAHMYHKLSSRNEQVAQMTMSEYANSTFIVDNWLTRNILKVKGKLTAKHVIIAKEVLRRKCLIGLVDQLDESMNRFVTYFGYHEILENCQQSYIDKAITDNKIVAVIEKNSQVWNSLLQHNSFDLDIYLYALELFEQQGRIMGNKFLRYSKQEHSIPRY